MTPNEIIAAETLAFGARPIRWRRSTRDFVESRCGFWHIIPIYGGLTRPESYELWFGASTWRRVGSGSTQRACKSVAEGLNNEPGQRNPPHRR